MPSSGRQVEKIVALSLFAIFLCSFAGRNNLCVLTNLDRCTQQETNGSDRASGATMSINVNNGTDLSREDNRKEEGETAVSKTRMDVVDTQSTNNNMNWTEDWLHNRLPSGDLPRILLLHVGKTGGSTFKKVVGLNFPIFTCLLAKRQVKQGATSYATLSLEDKLSCHRNNSRPGVGGSIVMMEHTGWTFSQPWLDNPTLKDFAMTEVANTFLFTIRNPVSRIASTFNWHRNQAFLRSENGTYKDNNGTFLPVRDARKRFQLDQNVRNWEQIRQVFYFDCFRTIEDVATALLREPRVVPTAIGNQTLNHQQEEVCLFAAKTLLRADDKPFPPKIVYLSQFFYNYLYYRQFSMDRNPNAPVLVVRMEHTTEDTRSITTALGGSDVPVNRTVNDSKSQFKVHSGLSSAKHQQVICCHLSWQEMEAYQSIVRRAVNLDHTDKQTTLQNQLEECGAHPHNNTKDLVQHPFSWKLWQQETCPNHKSSVVQR